MMKKHVTAICKNCGKEFGYSHEAYRLKAEEGSDKPERCNDCAMQNSSAARSTNSPYFHFRRGQKKHGNLLASKKGLGFRGKKVKKEKIWRASQSGMDISITDDEIIELYSKLESHQVVLMVSPTGTGKSTYVPKCLVQPPEKYTGDFIDRLIRQGQILITQPRIMATEGTAETTAKISGEEIGQRSLFGFRHSKDKESFSSGWNKCVSITDGTLPNWIREGKLGQYSLIMIDEVHERSCNIDLALGFLKRELHKYPQLRVIISSATINTESFLESFRKVGITCELFDIPSKKKFKKFEHFWRDENVSPNCSCWLCKKTAEERKRFWQQKQGTISERDIPEACSKLALEILDQTSHGSIIIFLHGESHINKVVQKIKSGCKGDIEVVPVYRQIQSQAKQELKRTEGKRRVIVATNIAETSITIPDLMYCINSGWIKQKVWDSATQTQKLESKLHSKDGNSQRGGRLGRTQDGYVYHLYIKDEVMDEHTSPEITRSCLDDSLAIVKSSGISGTGNFPWMEKVEESSSMSMEMQRADQSLHNRGVIDERGHVLEKALSLLKIPRSSVESSVIFMADEQGILFEVIVALMFMSDRDGTPHTGSNLYDPFCGLLCWDTAWTAETKEKISAIHQGLKMWCKDDLDFVVKLFLCFQQAKSDGFAKEWADYHCVNYKNLENIVSQIEELIESLGEEREESLRQLKLENLEKVRILFFSAWPEKVARLYDKQIWYKTSSKTGIVSTGSAGYWEDCDRDNILPMAFAEEEIIIEDFPKRTSVASFVVSMPESSGYEYLFCDQAFPVGCWVKTKKNGNSIAIEFFEIPLPRALRFKRNLWSEEREEESAIFNEAFRGLCIGKQSIEVEASWIGSGGESKPARIIRWENKNGIPVVVLSRLSEKSMYEIVKTWEYLEYPKEVPMEIYRVTRDPIGRNGWILGRIFEAEIPVEIKSIVLSNIGWGIEKIEGETLFPTLKGFEVGRLPQWSYIDDVTGDLKKIVKKISESTQETKSGKKFIDLPGVLTGIITDQEKAAVTIYRGDSALHIFEVDRSFVPGQNLKYLRLDEEVAVRLSVSDNRMEIAASRFTDEEIEEMPEDWEEGQPGQEVGKISIPLCIDEEDIETWNARPEAIDYIFRRSWQYCLQARIVQLTDRMRYSSLEQWMSVETIVTQVISRSGKQYIHGVLGDNIPFSGPKEILAPDKEVSQGDKLILCITSLRPLHLADRDTQIQRKQELIERWSTNISNSEDYIERLEGQMEKIQYALDNYRLSPDQKSEREGWLAEKEEKIEETTENIDQWKEKISSVQEELEKLEKKD